MRLLFDENLSPKLPRLLEAIFPNSIHARDCGLLGKTDDDVWSYARAHGFTNFVGFGLSTAQLTLWWSAKGYMASNRQLLA